MCFSDAPVDDLEVLSSVRYIDQYLEVSAVRPRLKSLAFLRNLEEIAGTVLHLSRFALNVDSNNELEELGLNSLRKIHTGNVSISNNEILCPSVTEQQLAEAGVVSSAGDVIYFFNLGMCCL